MVIIEWEMEDIGYGCVSMHGPDVVFVTDRSMGNERFNMLLMLRDKQRIHSEPQPAHP